LNDDPKKGWFYIAANRTIVVILYHLVCEKLKRKRLDRDVKSDLIVVQSILYQLLAEPTAISSSEEDK